MKGIICVYINIGCFLVLMMSLWAIDISTSAMHVNQVLDNANKEIYEAVNKSANNFTKGKIHVPEFQLTNGFMDRESTQVYHMGLYGVIFSALVMFFSTVWIAFEYRKRS